MRGGGSEAKEADAFAGLGSGDSQAAESDDAGAEKKRSDVGVVELGRQGEDEVGRGGELFSIAAVGGIAGEGGVVAEVSSWLRQKGAGAPSVVADPGDADPCADGEAGRSGAIGDFADDLVAEDEGLVNRSREVAFEDVEVGAADSQARTRGGGCGRE